MKKPFLLACAAASTLAAALTIATGVRSSSIAYAATLPTQTVRRIYACSGDLTWSGLYLYSWCTGKEKTQEMTYVCKIDDTYGDLYYVDVTLAETDGFLFLSSTNVTISGSTATPKWSSNSLQTVNADALPAWDLTAASPDIYLLNKNGTAKATVTAETALTSLSAAKVASILSHYTTCASDAAYTNGCLAYPQLQADFAIDNYYEDDTAVSVTDGGEKNGTTLANKILTLREEYEKCGGTCLDLPEPEAEFDGIRIYVEKKWSYVFLWGGASSASWPGDALTTSSSNGKWWLVELEGVSSSNIIFNKGSGKEQTEDLALSAKGTYYFYGGNWYTEDPTAGLYELDSGMRILHCFDWSLDAIEAALPEIKLAGYDAIQTSPLQAHKSYNGYWAQYESENWMYLYQPLSFSVAPSSSSYLGGTSDLKTLTASAEAYGIKVIVDVVANHMASGNTVKVFHKDVESYESDIYNDDDAIHEYVAQSDSSIKATVWGNIGMPDLNTANETVQARVLSYLKELIDDGVDGFRFDAAKHIETTQDGTYASDFWTNTYLAAKTYATNKGIDIFAYGEVLGWSGTGRSTSAYIDYAGFDAVTDDVTGNDLAAAIVANNYLVDDSYNTGLDAENNVLWAESHDTYMNSDGVSKGYSQDDVDATYALLSARKGANLLYFTRPSGTIGTPNSTKTWTSDIVAAANEFHGRFETRSERLSHSGKVTFVERYGSSDYGLVAVNPSSSNVSCTFSYLANGSYVDLITGSSYTISSKKLTVPANTTLILAKA